MGTGASAGRAVRVFISSTFADMQDEREELVKRVFPALRELCESRGVSWGEVDLRWGITDEQAAEGRVLPICLEEIQNCRALKHIQDAGVGAAVFALTHAN